MGNSQNNQTRQLSFNLSTSEVSRVSLWYQKRNQGDGTDRKSELAHTLFLAPLCGDDGQPVQQDGMVYFAAPLDVVSEVPLIADRSVHSRGHIEPSMAGDTRHKIVLRCVAASKGYAAELNKVVHDDEFGAFGWSEELKEASAEGQRRAKANQSFDKSMAKAVDAALEDEDAKALLRAKLLAELERLG